MPRGDVRLEARGIRGLREVVALAELATEVAQALELPRAEAALGDDAADVVHECRLAQLRRGEIDGEREALRRAVGLPGRDLTAGLLEHPAAEGQDRAVLFRERDELVGRHEAARRV